MTNLVPGPEQQPDSDDLNKLSVQTPTLEPAADPQLSFHAEGNLRALGLVVIEKIPNEGFVKNRGKYLPVKESPSEYSIFRQPERLVYRCAELYPHFERAPKEVKLRVKNALSKPNRSIEAIEKDVKPVNALIAASALRPGQEFDDQDRVTKIDRLEDLVSKFAFIKNEFQVQLKILQLKLGSFHELTDGLRHNHDYHPITKSLLLMGRALHILTKIQTELEALDEPRLKKIRNKIQARVTHKSLKPLRSAKSFLSLCSGELNPHLFNDIGRDIGEFNGTGYVTAVWDYEHGGRSVGPFGTRSDAERWVRDLEREAPESEVHATMLETIKAAKAEFEPLLKAFYGITDFSETGQSFDYVRQVFQSLMDGPISELGFHAAKANMIVREGYQFADVNDDGEGLVEIKNYHSPALEYEIAKQLRAYNYHYGSRGSSSVPAPKAEPMSIRVRGGEAKGISGPNKASKSEHLVAACRFATEAHAAMPVKATKAKVSVLKHISYLCPNARQYSGNLGNFAESMKRFVCVKKRSGPSTLVVADEQPKGADYRVETAAGVVVYKDLVDSGTSLIIATHIKPMLALLEKHTNLITEQTAVNVNNGVITPLFKLVPGIAEHSYGISLMHESGFDSRTIALAEAYYKMIMDKASKPDLSKVPEVETETAELDIFYNADPRQFLSEETKLDERRYVSFILEGLYPKENFALKGSRQLVFSAYHNRLQVIQDLTREEDELGLTEDSKSIFSYVERLGDLDVQEVKRIQTSLLESAATFDKRIERLNEHRDFGTIQQRQDRYEKLRQDYFNLATEVNESLQSLQLELMDLKLDDLALEIQQIKANFLNAIAPFFATLTNPIELKEKLEPDQLEAVQANAEVRDCLIHFANVVLRFRGGALGAYQMLDAILGVVSSSDMETFYMPELVEQAGVFEVENALPLELKTPTGFGYGAQTSPFIKDGVLLNFSLDAANAMEFLGPNGSGKTALVKNLQMLEFNAMNNLPCWGKVKLSNSEGSIKYFFGGETRPQANESYFSNVLMQLANFVKTVRPGDKVYLDEICGGDPIEVCAIQLAVRRRLVELGARLISNTNWRDGLESTREFGARIFETQVNINAEVTEFTPTFEYEEIEEVKVDPLGMLVAGRYLTEGQRARADAFYQELIG